MFLTSIDGCDVTTSRSKSMYSAAETSVESSLTKTFCVRFMEDDYGSNVHAGLEKSARFRVSALERFCYKGLLRNSSGTKIFVRLRELSALEDVRFREVPLYNSCVNQVYHKKRLNLDVSANKFYGKVLSRKPMQISTIRLFWSSFKIIRE